jgi:tRNA uridine 5-carbamoylmethylation protein Kti12
MKVILLSGKIDTGKTTTLNLLYDEITDKGKKRGIIIKDKEKLLNKDDFKCVLAYKNKKVAIYTLGDFLRTCTDAIIEYANLDILILAYSDKFERKMDDFVRKFDYHCVIDKHTSKDKRLHDKLNKKDCERIIEELNKD